MMKFQQLAPTLDGAFTNLPQAPNSKPLFEDFQSLSRVTENTQNAQGSLEKQLQAEKSKVEQLKNLMHEMNSENKKLETRLK